MHHDLPAICLAPGCMARPMSLAPVPLCPTHVREAYEFAQSIVDDRWQAAIAETAAEPRKPEPVTPLKLSDADGWVYFVRIGEEIKIGFSTYPAARFKALRPDEVLAIVPGKIADERRCHAAFDHLRTHGEYFRPEPELLAFIARLPNAA